MAYTKLPKVVADFALGYQSLNVLRENFSAQYAAWIAEHGESEPQYDRDRNPIYPAAFQAIGHHNTPLIPRDVVLVRAPSFGVFGASFSYTASNFLVAATYLQRGRYFFEVGSLATYWGQGCAKVTSTTTLSRVACRSIVPSNPGDRPGISVAAYTQDATSNTWVLSDFNFTLSVYGTIS